MSKFNVGDKVIWNPFGTEHEGVISAVGPLSESGFDYAVAIEGNPTNDFLSTITGDGGEWAWEQELTTHE